MKTEGAPTYPIRIWMAGNIRKARKLACAYCDEVGFCVTVTPTTYVYTGGQEVGFVIGLINYPRFPLDPLGLQAHAEALAERLRVGLAQDSYCIEAPMGTIWFSHREQDA